MSINVLCQYRMWYYWISLFLVHTAKDSTRNDLNFIWLGITANLHASHQKGGECLQKMKPIGSLDLHAELIMSGEEDHSI